jgi:endoglucanase Acf2
MRSFLPPQNLAPTIGQDRPIPTNAWWGNLIAYDASERVQPVWSMPYAVVVDKELPP